MARMKFLCDADRCIECNACVTACKNEHEVPWGINRRRVVTLNDGKPGERSVSMACMHCTDAPCAAVCPVNCFYTTADAVVLHSKDICIGCGYCFYACPFGAPQYPRVGNFGSRGKMDKCTYCSGGPEPDLSVAEYEKYGSNRLAEGKLPLCAEMCSTKALLAGDGEMIAEIYKQRVIKRGYGSGAWGWKTAYRDRRDLIATDMHKGSPPARLSRTTRHAKGTPMRRAVTLLSTLVLATTLLVAPGAFAPVQAQNPITKDGQNPMGAKPTADSVNEEFLFKNADKITGRVSIPDGKAANLIQPQGREYQSFREGYLPWIGAIFILGMVAALGAFFLWRGRILTDDTQESGRKILRFNAFERFTHWMTAVCFIILSLSGLNYIFGPAFIPS
jgi:formate dehydrogenase iron-sulfur subunit